MDEQDDQQNPLQAVMFIPGNYSSLFNSSKYRLFDQLDGVRELLDIADSYVLNDTTIVRGLRLHDDNDMRRFLLHETERSDSVEMINDEELSSFQQHLGVYELDSQIREFDKSCDHQLSQIEDYVVRSDLMRDFDLARGSLFNEINDREAQALILFTDKIEASYIPERLFGDKALKSYPDLLNKSPHFMKEDFAKRLMEQLSLIHARDSAIKTMIPSFLFEALKSSETSGGIGSALRDLRYSAAARHYREMVRVMTNDEEPEEERQSAYSDLDAQVSTAFSKEGLKPRIPRMFKLTVALSSFAVSLLFPLAAAAPLLIEAGEEIDRWIRLRNNIFEHYPVASYENLHTELKRLFPNIGFQPPHLAHFLQHRDFGWPDKLSTYKFL